MYNINISKVQKVFSTEYRWRSDLFFLMREESSHEHSVYNWVKDGARTHNVQNHNLPGYHYRTITMYWGVKRGSNPHKFLHFLEPQSSRNPFTDYWHSGSWGVRTLASYFRPSSLANYPLHHLGKLPYIVVPVGLEPTLSYDPVYQTGDSTIHPRHNIIKT